MGASRRYGAVAAIAFASVVAAGCGESVEDAEQSLCADLATLRSNVATLASLDGESTVEEFRQARQNVRDSWREVQASADNLGTDRADAVEDAWDNLADTIDDVDDDQSVSEALEEIGDAREELSEASAKLGSGIDCQEDAHDSMMMEDS